jgi:hypothetical protein
MTSPFPAPTEDEKLKRHLEKGGKVSLDSRQTFKALPATLQAPQPTVISFPGTQRLLDKVQTDIKVRLNLSFTHAETPDFVVFAFLNTPNANAGTPITSPGYVGPTAFFGGGPGNAHHGESVARLNAGLAVKRVGGAEAITVTLVPVGYPGRGVKAQTVQVTASLELLSSKVEKLR